MNFEQELPKPLFVYKSEDDADKAIDYLTVCLDAFLATHGVTNYGLVCSVSLMKDGKIEEHKCVVGNNHKTELQWIAEMKG